MIDEINKEVIMKRVTLSSVEETMYGIYLSQLSCFKPAVHWVLERRVTERWVSLFSL